MPERADRALLWQADTRCRQRSGMLEGLYENLITKRLQEMLLDVTDLDVSTDEIDAGRAA